MTANRSNAVMATRVEPHKSLDDFPTPPYAGRALFEHVLKRRSVKSILEPTCNRGYLARGLLDYTNDLRLADIHDYGIDAEQRDFLFPSNNQTDTQSEKPELIATNPPFRLAEQFIFAALEQTSDLVAMFVRTSFVESIGRYHNLFSVHRPSIIAHFSERVIIAKGILRDPAIKYFCAKSQTWKRPSTATSYSWMVWHKKPTTRTDTIWIPPCRKDLERQGDYNQAGFV